MAHPLVTQLQFTRSEFARCFDGIPPGDAVRRVEPMNCLSWAVGHLALQEQFFWIQLAQGRIVEPGLVLRFGTGQPASIPPWDEMWSLWHTITKEADTYLNAVKPEDLRVFFRWEGKAMPEDAGTLLLRNIYHYWFHLGKVHSVRQMMGHDRLPGYVGDMSSVRYAMDA